MSEQELWDDDTEEGSGREEEEKEAGKSGGVEYGQDCNKEEEETEV